MIDSHIHSDTRPYEDFEKMALCFDCAITLAHDPLEPYSMDILRAHFDKIIYNEIERANKTGLKLFVCLGIHPRMIPSDVNYNILREYLKAKNVVGVGEIGLEKCTKEEIEVFKEQLLIAEELNMPLLKEMNKAVGIYTSQNRGNSKLKLANDINLAGKQRMLTQKMGKDLLFISNKFKPKYYISDFSKSRKLFAKTLDGLFNGDKKLKLVGTNCQI